MNEVAQQYNPRDVGSYFIYTNEAHPGELIPHHTSFEQKLAQAGLMTERIGSGRPILVDTLQGHCHQYFGSMPNMTWIFNRAGRPQYSSDWTDSGSVANALDYYLAVATGRRSGANVTGFNVRRLDYRERDRARFFEILALGGRAAVEQFEAMFGPQWPVGDE
ncbi:hypothetical protein KDL29_01615 [bacterium]|nr:hypothetical protein [bacterium]